MTSAGRSWRRLSPGLHAHLRDLEERHLQPGIRSSAEALRALLAEDFIEFGSSGRVYDRDAVVDAVSAETAFTATLDDFAARLLAPRVALTTYRLSVRSDGKSSVRTTLRSSVWVERGGRWLLLFHQGTPAPGR
jgi:hypothetical protein